MRDHRPNGRRLSVAAAMLALLVAAGCGDKVESEASYIQRGRELAAKGDLAAADVMLRNALQINPKSAEALTQLALNAERRGDPQAAFRLYLRVTEEKPDSAFAQAKVGQIYAAGGNLRQARQQVEKAIALDPELAEVILLQGLIAFRANDLAAAEERARAVLARDPDSVDANGLLARALDEMGKVDAAVAAYDAALQRRPDATALRVMKARTLERAKRFDAAEASYRELIDREPAAYPHRRDLVRVLEGTGRGADAEKVLREAIAGGAGGTTAKLDLVELFVRQDRPDVAEAELARMAAEAPAEYQLQLRLADRYIRTERLADAKAVLEAVVKRDSEGPNGIAARVALARLAIAGGEAERADALVADVLKIERGNADALMLRAGRAIERNDAEAAIVDLRTVLRDNPGDREAKRQLANAYFRAGKSDLAERELAALASRDATDVGVKYDLAYLQARRGSSSEAIGLLEEVTTAAPQLVAPLRAKAMMEIVEKQWSAAEDTIRRIEALPDQQRLANMLSGMLYLASERPKEAAAAYERAHRLAPADPAPIEGVVRAQLQQGDVDGAIRFVRRLIDATPDSAFLYNGLGELLLLAGKPEETVAALAKATAIRPDWPLPYFNTARAHLARNDHARAIAALDDGLQRSPDDPLLLRGRADTQLLQGRHADALASYLQVLRSQPDDSDAANNAAAIIAAYQFEDPAAMAKALDLVKRFEDSTSPNYLDTLGWVRYRAGEYELAKIALNRAVKRLPDDPEINYHLGMVRYRLGDREGARAALEKATTPEVRDYPGIAEARETLRRLGEGGARP